MTRFWQPRQQLSDSFFALPDKAFRPCPADSHQCCVSSEAHEYMPKIRPGKPVTGKFCGWLRAGERAFYIDRELTEKVASGPLG